MKKISMLIICFAMIVLSTGGCKFFKELRNPPKRKARPKPEAYKPATLPDGTSTGLNNYEMQYIKDIDQDFRQQQRMNSRKVFGGSRP